ncbi:DUF2520 domain-containing protein [Clostridium sp. OS1-26]|uniref:Rossmann-like and DUF2520 domain-containing protein n=1 Tax=Clostridium sp. OS1-26 TaxID=3070681 RepID=UPI0027E0B16D|nr:DUF2520 domain-containing protein [Clostridium sp. OS1-26]WML33523.1 DUF2520 domain-containing protein [Clostridium sp. OS1-26]
MLYHTYGGDTIKIGFIGPGKVGVNLGRYFTHKGLDLSGFYGKDIKSASEAANITKSKFYDNIQELIKESDILFITTSDDIISIIDSKLSKFDLKSKSICHTSGSLKSNVLCNAKHSGALIYSIHPIFAFSNKNMNLEGFEKIYFSIEGDILEDSIVLKLFKVLGNNFFIRDKETSSTYHLANVFISNLILSLLEVGINYFKALGLREEEALKAVKPLINGNIESIYSKGFINSLTGPVLRGDVKTIEKHLSVLKEKDKKLYSLLSLNLLNLVALKNFEKKDYTHSSIVNNGDILKNLLKNSKKHLEIYEILGGTE